MKKQEVCFRPEDLLSTACGGGTHILSFCFSVCQKQNIIYSWDIFLVLVCDMAQQNVALFSNKYPKLVCMVRSHFTLKDIKTFG